MPEREGGRATIFAFADLALDIGRRQLSREGVAVPLSRLAFSVLRVLVEAAPAAVGYSDLVNKAWGPRRVVTPENVSQRVLLLRRALGDDAARPRYIEGIRGYGYRLIPEVRLVGEQPATTPAEDRFAGAQRNEKPARPARRWQLFAVLALALAALGVGTRYLEGTSATDAAALVASPAAEGSRSSPADVSIAVLAFADLSETGDQQYFSAGIAEEILSLLDGVSGLRVAARASAFSFDDESVSASEIARRLNVNHVLEGSVRRAGDELRITVKLIEAHTDSQVWAATYERETGDVFAIQQEIATEVAGRLRVLVTDLGKGVDRTSAVVYADYLRAKYINYGPIADSLPYARELMERAVERDPNYYPARDELTRTYFLLAGSSSLTYPESQSLVRQSVADAARTWPDRPEVMGWQGYLSYVYDRDLERAARLIEQALAADPANPALLSGAQTVALALGRPETVIAIGEYQIARDPLWHAHYGLLMDAYLRLERYDDVERVYRTAAALDIELPMLRGLYGLALLLRGDAAAALPQFEALEELEPREAAQMYARMGAAMAHHALGREAEAAASAARLRDYAGERGWSERAGLEIYRGDLDAAFDVMSSAPDTVRPRPDLFDAPILRELRTHPRWPELAAKFALGPDDARSRIRFDVRLPE